MPLLPGPGSEFANFGDCDVLMGLTTDEAWLELTEQDLEVRSIYLDVKKIFHATVVALLRHECVTFQDFYCSFLRREFSRVLQHSDVTHHLNLISIIASRLAESIPGT